MGVAFYIDIEDSAGTKQGSGPITSAARWRYTARMDRAGSFAFVMPASDTKAAEVQKKRIARAWALINDVWTEVGAGIIDNIEKVPGNNGQVTLSVSGDSEERELNYRSVGFLELADTNDGMLHGDAVDAIAAYTPSGWVFEPDYDPGNDFVYGRFAGESVLQAAIKLAEKTQSHFYRSGQRTLTFDSSFSPSGIRAIQARHELVAETCAIVSLVETINTYDLITRIYPFGAGQGQARLTLAATTRSAPTGYTFSAANNYIQNTAANSTYGQIEQYVEFKDVAPVSNTDADLEAAANMLFDVALEELRRRSTELEQATYKVKLAQCSALLRPMQTLRVIYRDVDGDMDVDADLNILEATIDISPNEIRTTDVIVSTADRWPESDADAIVGNMMQGQMFSAHPQLNANSYVTAYLKNVDADEMATFRFRFGIEVVNLQQVLFEFQLLAFESTVKSISSPVASSSSGGSSTPTTSSGGDQVPSSASGGSSTPTSGSAGSQTPTSAGGSTHTHTVTVAAHTHAVPDHQHTLIIAGGSGSVTNVLLGVGGTTGFLQRAAAGDLNVFTTPTSGATTASSGGSSTPTSSSEGTHTHTVTIASHTHTVTSVAHTHTVTITAHTHTVTVAAHTHTVATEIDTIYGIFREVAARTYDISELEYQVNSGSWVSLDTADDVSNGWYALDITDDVQNATTFRPLQTNNTLKIRAKSNLLSISQWVETGTGDLDMTVSSAHGLSAGALVLIAGEALGGLGTDVNGLWTVTSITSTVRFVATSSTTTIVNGDGNLFGTGSVTPQHTTTIEAQLSIRNTIQAIAYV